MPAIRCPSCSTKYKVSAAAGGRRTTCKKCGQRFKIPEFVSPTEITGESEVLRFKDDDLDAISSGAPVQTERPAPPPPPAVPAEAIPTSETVAYATNDQGDESGKLPPGAYTGYFNAIGRSMLFPTRTGDLVTFVILVVALIIGEFLGMARTCFAGAGYLIIQGWYMAFQLNTVTGAAGNEEDLPDLALTGGWWDDIFAPWLKMMATMVMASLPAVIFFVSSAGTAAWATLGGGGGAAGGATLNTAISGALVAQLMIGMSLLALGYFVWPILVLIVSCGSITSLFRLDLVIKTIGRTIPAYLLVLLVVYTSIGFDWGSYIAIAAIQGDKPFYMQDSLLLAFGLPIVATVISAYATIVAMRAIGLYYHFFKERFAWSWG